MEWAVPITAHVLNQAKNLFFEVDCILSTHIQANWTERLLSIERFERDNTSCSATFKLEDAKTFGGLMYLCGFVCLLLLRSKG